MPSLSHHEGSVSNLLIPYLMNDYATILGILLWLKVMNFGCWHRSTNKTCSGYDKLKGIWIYHKYVLSNSQHSRNQATHTLLAIYSTMLFKVVWFFLILNTSIIHYHRYTSSCMLRSTNHVRIFCGWTPSLMGFREGWILSAATLFQWFIGVETLRSTLKVSPTSRKSGK